MEMVCVAKKETIHDAITAIGAKPESDMKGVYSLNEDPYFNIIIVNKERAYISITVSMNFGQLEIRNEKLNELNTDPTMGTHSVIQNAYLYRQIQYFDHNGICVEEVRRIIKECHANADRGYGYLIL